MSQGGENSAGLLNPALVRELAARFGVTPTKKLGQNFVHDPNTVRKIVRAAGVRAADRVVEVGPGLGSLTLGLTETGASVTAVEIDPVLASQIAQTVESLQPDAEFQVVHADAMQVSELPEEPDILVANLPYNVSVPILMHFLETFPTLTRALVMVQLEVGERIAALPGSKAYGAPSVKAAWYGPWKLAGHVSRKIFWPVPGVDSVLVEFDKLATERGSQAERELTFELVNAAFGQRRKMLRQSLQGVRSLPSLANADAVSAAVERAGVAPTARAEQLTIDDYHNIAKVLLAQVQ